MSPSLVGLPGMSVKQLMGFLQNHLRVSTAGLLEKTELLKLAKAGRAAVLFWAVAVPVCLGDKDDNNN